MDLTNIKPCVECKFFAKCDAKYNPVLASWSMSSLRVAKLLILGEDCFEEVDDDKDSCD